MKARFIFWTALMVAFSLFGHIRFSPAAANRAAGCDGIIGTWRWFNGATVTCDENGICTASNGFAGPWRCRKAPGTFEIRWGRGGKKALYVDTLRLSHDGTQLAGKNQLDGGVSARRIFVDRRQTAREIDRSLADDAQFPEAISDQQQQLVDEFGWPQSFLITFTTEENGGERQKFRYETWYYYNVWTSFSFINGIFTESEGIDRLKGDIDPLPYTPYDFKHGMQWREVQRLAGHQKVVRLTPHDLAWDDVPGAENVNVYFAGRTIAGFDGSGLTLLLALPQVTAQQQP